MTSLQKQLSGNHRRASKMLAFALHADSVDIWSDAALVWRARLTDRENGALAYSSLRALDPDHAVLVVEAAFDKPTMPMVPLFSAMHEAAHWADWAESYPSLRSSGSQSSRRHVTILLHSGGNTADDLSGYCIR